MSKQRDAQRSLPGATRSSGANDPQRVCLQMLDAVGEAVIATDPAGAITYWNAAAEEIYGYSTAEARGRSLDELIVPDPSHEQAQRLMAAVGSGQSWTGEILVRSHDGREFPGRVTATPVYGDAGQVAGMIGVSRDITGDVQARTAIAEREELFRRVFDESPVGKAIIGPDLRIRRVNQALCSLLGYSSQELAGVNPRELTHADDVATDEGLAARAMSGEIGGYKLEKRFVAKDGSTLDVVVSASVVRGAGNEVLYGVGVVENVTEVKQAQRRLQEQDRRLALALDAARASVWDVDLTTGSVTVSENIEADFAISAPRTLQEALELVHPDDRPVVERLVRGKETFNETLRALDGHGDVRWIQAQGKVLADHHGRRLRIQGVTLDVTTSHEAERRRKEADLAFRTVIETSVDAFVGMDAFGNVTDWNAAAEGLFGWNRHEALGRPLAEMIIPTARRPAHLMAVERLRGHGMPTGMVFRREVEAQHRDGRLFPVELAVTAVAEDDDVRFKAFIRDLTERKRYEKQLARRAVTDPLTGLPNRTLLLDRLTAAISRLQRQERTLVVMFVDVDRFKVVNDSLGHGAGDRLLAAIADRMRRALRPDDTLARFGGDEFVVICEDLSSGHDTTLVAERLLDAMREKFVIEGRDLVVDVSIGIALASSGHEDAEGLIRDADAAMYRAKKRTGARWALFDDQLRASAIARLELERELRAAIDRKDLRVFYQPVVTLEEGTVAVEALVRWQHPTRGMVSPAEFIPTAEETGLIAPLGEFVLEEACAQLATWRSDPAMAELSVTVNLSGRQLTDPDLPARVAALLARHRLAPGALCLEITESVLMEETGTAAESLQALHELGVNLAVDDFGTGYSSLLSLRRFPVGVLKLDRFFVAGLGRNESDTAIVGSVIQLAHSLGLLAVAEGVETEDQLIALRALGCDRAQGYLWSRPLPPAEVEQLLREPRTPRAGHASSLRPAPEGLAKPTPAQPSAAAEADSGHCRVLVVDDSEAERSLIRATLESDGLFTVIAQAANGHEALQKAVAHHPDVVLLDLSMPGMDGITALRELIRVCPDARVIVLSGFVSAGIARSVTHAGAVGCLDKNLSAEQLLSEVKAFAVPPQLVEG
jgi:diguanylate cyclase (GGDEF)-like protein/PAS domain S-box-containing protein